MKKEIDFRKISSTCSKRDTNFSSRVSNEIELLQLTDVFVNRNLLLRFVIFIPKYI